MSNAGTSNFGVTGGGFFAADGANNNSAPTALSGTPLGLVSAPSTTSTTNGTAAAVMVTTCGPMIYTVSSNTSVFLVPQVSAATGTVTGVTGMMAERISST